MLFACKKKNKFNINVENINVKLKIQRFDIDFFNLSSDSLMYQIPKLEKKYGDFFNIYNSQLIGIGLPDQKNYYKNLEDFLYYCNQMDLANKVWKVFPKNDTYIKNSLTNAFKHYKYYFPQKNIPKIITVISGFNVSVFTGQNFIGISLDKYLGKNFKPYKAMFEQYLYRRMTKNMIPVDVMKALCVQQFPFNDSINTVLTNMIYQGKIQYFLDAMLPNTPDTLKWGYTTQQWGWANKYESKIWDFMVSEKILFSNKSLDIKTYTAEAPFTTPFKNNSAPRSGSFIGYKIIQAYMKNNKNITLQQLMKENDYMKIYNNSYYQP